MTAIVSRYGAAVAVAGALAVVVSLLVMLALPVVAWPVAGTLAGAAGWLVERGESA